MKVNRKNVMFKLTISKIVRLYTYQIVTGNRCPDTQLWLLAANNWFYLQNVALFTHWVLLQTSSVRSSRTILSLPRATGLSARARRSRRTRSGTSRSRTTRYTRRKKTKMKWVAGLEIGTAKMIMGVEGCTTGRERARRGLGVGMSVSWRTTKMTTSCRRKRLQSRSSGRRTRASNWRPWSRKPMKSISMARNTGITSPTTRTSARWYSASSRKRLTAGTSSGEYTVTLTLECW